MRGKLLILALLAGAICAASDEGDYKLDDTSIRLTKPAWVTKSMLDNATKPPQGELPITAERLAQMFRTAETAVGTVYAPWGGDTPSNGWKLKTADKNFAQMSPLVDVEPKFAQRLIDLSYLPVTNGASTARTDGGVVWSPMFFGRWSKPSIVSWYESQPRAFSPSRWAMGLMSGYVRGDSVSLEWANRFKAVLQAAGADVSGATDSAMRAAIHADRSRMRSAFTDETGIEWDTFDGESSIAKEGHPRLPAALDIRAGDWFARNADALFVYVPAGLWKFDREVMKGTNKYTIAKSSIESKVKAAIAEGAGTHYTDTIGGSPSEVSGSWTVDGIKTNSPVRSWEMTYSPAYPSARAWAVYKIVSKQKSGDTGWRLVYTVSVPGGRREYYRRDWHETDVTQFDRPVCSSASYVWECDHLWMRAIGFNMTADFPDYSGWGNGSNFSSGECDYYAGGRYLVDYFDCLSGQESTSTNCALIVGSDSRHYLESLVGDAVFEQSIEALGHHEWNGVFDIGLTAEVTYTAPTSERDVSRYKMVELDDETGETKETYYEGDPHDQDGPPTGDEDGDGIPDDAPPAGDPDGGGSGSGQGADDEIWVLVDVSFTQDHAMGGVSYERYTFTPSPIIVRFPFDFAK